MLRSNITVYPNPSQNGIFYLRGIPAQAKLTILDPVGKLLMVRNEIAANINIDLSSFGPGAYFVNITSNGQDVNFRVVVIE